MIASIALISVGFLNIILAGFYDDSQQTFWPEVVGRWSSSEGKILIPRINTAVEMVKSFILAGMAKTMSEFNNK
ncbi:MAG TPA: hypothetical protein PLJ84_02365 [Bacteroidales bacterium]|nr:hypothetical protein [Bacteroidales bacterium]